MPANVSNREISNPCGQIRDPGRHRVMASSLVALVALVVAAAVAAIVAVARFEQFCLNDLAQTPDYELRLFTRQAWTVLIILWIPFGGLAYLSVGTWR